jgi:exosortase H (IPTLxxWG-CTERM-specific)
VPDRHERRCGRESRPRTRQLAAAPRGEDRPAPPAAAWRSYWREVRFIALFLLLLGGGFALVSLNWMNDHAIEPFTAGIARASAGALDLLGQHTTREGTAIRGVRFAVNIRNGCNGVETMLIFLAAVLAFPATWRARLAGLVLGIAGIQVVNLVRVVALFLTGAYLPRLFDTSHTVVWQTFVILFGVLAWIYWASRFATRLGSQFDSRFDSDHEPTV